MPWGLLPRRRGLFLPCFLLMVPTTPWAQHKRPCSSAVFLPTLRGRLDGPSFSSLLAALCHGSQHTEQACTPKGHADISGPECSSPGWPHSAFSSYIQLHCMAVRPEVTGTSKAIPSGICCCLLPTCCSFLDCDEPNLWPPSQPRASSISRSPCGTDHYLCRPATLPRPHSTRPSSTWTELLQQRLCGSTLPTGLASH